MNDIRLIALDMDGTLLTSRKEISPRTVDALLRVQQKMVRLALCSARPLAGITPYAEQLQIPQNGGYIAAYGGAEIIRCGKGNRGRLYYQAMPPADLHRLYRIAKASDLNILTYRDDVLYTADDDVYITKEANDNFLRICRVKDFCRDVNFDSPKCLLTGEPAAVEKAFPAIAATCRGQFEAVVSAPFFLEICPAGIDKRHALKALMAAEHLQKEQVAAFGDSRNDLPMLRAAGFGIAMENAVQEAKELAFLTTDSNEKDGIAKVVEQYWL